MTKKNPQEAAFLKAIRESPQDDGLRLAFADWLEEHGDPWAEFIRVQIQLTVTPPFMRHGTYLTAHGEDYHPVAYKLQSQMQFIFKHLVAIGHRFVRPQYTTGNVTMEDHHYCYWKPGHTPVFLYCRGFVEKIVCKKSRLPLILRRSSIAFHPIEVIQTDHQGPFSSRWRGVRFHRF
jgi:uncharacterized protein (TIGR02996 family)